MKKPGVYVVENNAFPNEVVEVATAVPVFIGYTEKGYEGQAKPPQRPDTYHFLAGICFIFW